jgi:hypothetical protein
LLSLLLQRVYQLNWHLVVQNQMHLKMPDLLKSQLQKLLQPPKRKKNQLKNQRKKRKTKMQELLKKKKNLMVVDHIQTMELLKLQTSMMMLKLLDLFAMVEIRVNVSSELFLNKHQLKLPKLLQRKRKLPELLKKLRRRKNLIIMVSRKHLTEMILHQLKDQFVTEETKESARQVHLLNRPQRRKKLSQLKKKRKNQILSQKKPFLTAMNTVITSMEKVLKKDVVQLMKSLPLMNHGNLTTNTLKKCSLTELTG